MRTSIIAWMWLFAACSSTQLGLDLFVDLKTDLVPNQEFHAIRLRIATDRDAANGTIQIHIDANQALDYVQGVRIGEFRQLMGNEVTVDVSLLDDDGSVVVERPTRLVLNRSRAMTVVISRDCRGVQCPLADADPNLSACFGGRCVDPRCHPEEIQYCEAEALECNGDAQCITTHACISPRCVERVCFFEPDDGLCEPLQMCVPESGCTDSEPEPSCDDGIQNGNETSVDCGGECECPPSQWLRTFGDTAGDQPVALAVDSEQNVTIVGNFRGNVDFGSGVLGGGVWSNFIASFDAQSAARWSTQIGGFQTLVDGVIGNGDALVVVGTGFTLQDESYGIIRTYDKDGQAGWTRDITNASIRAVAADAQGNIYVAGTFGGSADFGNGVPIVSNGDSDIFVASYRSDDGSYRWANAYGDVQIEQVNGIAARADGTHAIVGTFAGSVNFGGSALVASSPSDLFIASFDANGAHGWSQRAGISPAFEGHGKPSFGSQGELFVAGAFQPSVDFGGGTLSSDGGEDAFIVAMDAASGSFLWHRRIGGTGDDSIEALDAGENGGLTVCGYFSNMVDFGSLIHTSLGGQDAFAAVYQTTDGNSVDSQAIGGIGEDSCSALHGGLLSYVTGRFENTFSLGAAEATSAGQSDIFLIGTRDAF